MAYSKDVIYFSIPDFYNLYNLNMILLTYMDNRPDWFRENVKVDSMYGTFPGCIWNSGRGQFGQAPLENIVQTVASINKLGVSVRYTFTNSLLEGKQFKDHYGNTILTVTDSGMNGINVSDPAFADYLSVSYPNYYLMWSTTKGVKTVEEVNKLSADRLTVPPYNMNNTDAVTQFEHPENIELLCCETCIDNCPNRASHYEDISKGQLLMPNKQFKCPHGCEMYYYHDIVPDRQHHITIESMEQDYLPIGINKFKISGRNDNVINVVERYVEYFPKPEFKDIVRNHLLVDLFK